jgi:hypothetical protein
VTFFHELRGHLFSRDIRIPPVGEENEVVCEVLNPLVILPAIAHHIGCNVPYRRMFHCASDAVEPYYVLHLVLHDGNKQINVGDRQDELWVVGAEYSSTLGCGYPYAHGRAFGWVHFDELHSHRHRTVPRLGYEELALGAY